ncbi:MAG TPA: hypothetical protein VFZ65_21795 [Planctomycetota bacterium]|nr:hypothetical protein [Planctomycetota bacterium]
MRAPRGAWCLCATAIAGCTAAHRATWPIVCEETFASASSLDRFAFSDAARWRWSPAGPCLELLGDSHYAPPVRSPTSIALVRDLEVADFDLEVDVLQTGRDYGHRDLCLFFGFESPTRFYYVHLAQAPDANAHNVFVVQDAPRKNLAPVAAHGIQWGDHVWHHVRVERRTKPGTIRVFWDRQPEPILQATSTAFVWGRVGFGSFDDSGLLAGLRLWAPAARTAATGDPFSTR